MIELSKDQKRVLNTLLDWHKSGCKTQYITVGGYAGTGKTTLISILSKELHRRNKKLRIAFVSFTGKATQVLKNKILESRALYPRDRISTIHSLIYSPIENSKGVITGWKLKEDVVYDLIIIDEASMVDQKIWKDLCSFKVPIIAVGDHGQLPPVNGSFNLMEKPTLKLEEIHRQAKDNPIIKLSIMAREEGLVPFGTYSYSVMKIERRNSETASFVENLLSEFNPNTLILCGYNITRVKLNTYIREKLGFDSSLPLVNDRVICLRNNHEKDIYNGMLGVVKNIDEKNERLFSASLKMDYNNKLYEGLIYKEQFNNQQSFNFTGERRRFLNGDLFDFGYALTVHKAQGSQAKRVILFEERFSKMNDEEWRRWLYTGVTRAEEELFIIG